MSVNRRNFIKKTAMAGALVPLALEKVLASTEFKQEDLFKGTLIEVNRPGDRNYWKPLEELSITIHGNLKNAGIKVWDAAGNNYVTTDTVPTLHFRVGGALGYHKVTLHDKHGQVTDWAAFPVDCETGLSDESGEFESFWDILFETLTTSYVGFGKTVRYNQKYYRQFSSWFQDHVFAAEGLKYFTDDLKSGIDLYADGQREDGLIWDNYKHPYPELQSYWEYRFDYGGFTYRPEDRRSSAIFVRIPVENIGEHTFLEGLYYAWKATGDDRWMETKLDHALKAVKFATSSPWYWSEEYQLLKRPYSIDRWDFQSDYDAKISGTDFMGADLERTRYGVMFGDNICMANGCTWLAEMLEHAGRKKEAEEMREQSRDLWKRINDLSWNGEFYRHWVPVENKQDLDFGVDTEQQVTLSNAMALIRGVDHEKAVRIIESYLRIKAEMPGSSPGEWYMCYPPYERGWHVDKWEYMNGGVSPILAGDLALGAFEHGYEQYAVDILRRLYEVTKRSAYRLRGCYKGKLPDPPERNFRTIDLKSLANADIVAGDPESGPFFGSEQADLRNLPTGKQEFEQVLFEVIDRTENDRRACLMIKEGSEEVLVGQNAGSLYLLHVTDGNGIAGIFHIHYADGTTFSRYIRNNTEIGHLWYPALPPSNKGIPNLAVAWRGPADVVKDVGIYAFGMDNPHPEREIDRFEFYNPSSSNWAVLGITLSDAPHFFQPSIVSTIPDHWAAAHVIKAMMEGLAGIKNTGEAFRRVKVCPRWEAAGVKKAGATAKYVPSGGYAAYTYEKIAGNEYQIVFTGNALEAELELLIPEGKQIDMFSVNGNESGFLLKETEGSRYACARIEGAGVKTVVMKVS